MTSAGVRDPLDRALLGRLGRRARGHEADPRLLAEDLGLLREAGYLKIAVPAAFGGAGLTLPQVACAQRRLAYHAPAAALAVNAHHAWVGAAATARASGEPATDWLLTEAARGSLVAGPGGAAGDLLRVTAPGSGGTPGALALSTGPGPRGWEIPGSASPGWDWLGVQTVDDSVPGEPKIVHAFLQRSGPGYRVACVVPPGRPGDAFTAGVFGWGLPLDGELCYAIARRAYDRATERANVRLAAAGTEPPAAELGMPFDQWHLAGAAVCLEYIRDRLNAVLYGWTERHRAGAPFTALDPGGQWLIRLFTVRHLAADGARRAAELAAQVGSGTAGPAPGPVAAA